MIKNVAQQTIEEIADEYVDLIDSYDEIEEPVKEEREETASEIAEQIVQAEDDRRSGFITEVLEGVTFGFLGELVSAAKAATSDREYDEIKTEYEAKRRIWKRNNPELADYALPLEIAATLPTGIGLAKGLAKAGVKTITKQGAVEGSLYGLGTGDGLEERVIGAAMGAFGGATLGRIVDLAVKPAAKGGLKTQADEAADLAIVRDTELDDIAIQKAIDAERYAEVETKDYIVKPISEAKTFGEFWSSITGNLRKFYDSAITGTSDDVSRNVSRDVGSRMQRADETALREINKGLGTLAERLVPVIQIINESTRAKGALLDFGANKFVEKGTRQESLNRLKNELSTDLNAEHMKTLEEYLDYSYRKNTVLNAKVFGGTFDADTTYLHTRDRSFIKEKKEKGLTDSEIEKMFDDPAQRPRTRGSYTDQIPNADGRIPRPDDYDNPIISDMQRIFRMERLNQIQRIFGVKIDDVLATKRSLAKNPDKVVLSPQEFMDATLFTINKKGISADGSKYAVDRMTETIMGQDATPHPLIQALSSASYATTLAGPMSAILNLADIPMLGAKYGGRAVLEGLKEANPKKFFGKPSDIDLEKMGLGNQNFGEFVNKVNEKIADTNGWLSRTTNGVREGADFLMKGSGFAAMDKVGKKGVMRGVLKSAADDAKAERLGDNWSFYFNKSELDILERELTQHGMNWQNYQGKGRDLIEELMFAGLGQQQLISAAGRPAAWARNPNLRPLWALRGFVVKQQALALRETVGNIKAGKPDKAAEFLGRYAIYGAGGYAIINEGRQFIFGDGEVSAGGLVRGYGDAWASLLTANTLGLNDYQFGRIKENGIALTFLEGMVPIAIDRPLDIGSGVVDAIDRDRYLREPIVDALPVIKQSARGMRNIGSMFGLDVEPIESVLERKPRN